MLQFKDANGWVATTEKQPVVQEQPAFVMPQQWSEIKHLRILDGQSVLVTGGTGTFGQAFIPYLLEYTNVSRLVVLSRDWGKQDELRQRLTEEQLDRVRFFTYDIRDYRHLMSAFRNINVVVHAAAYKHVVFAEANPLECIDINVQGSINVARAAINCGVEKVLAVSSDKACSPTNLYGATKLLMERLTTQSNAIAAATPTRLSCVRYGNVLGARGSVLEIWEGCYDDIPVTDPLMTRFVITVEQTCDFVLRALGCMQGGEVFVPKLGACTIADLAQARYPEKSTHITGVRPGEKRHEVLVSEDEINHTVDAGWCYVVKPEVRMWSVGHDWHGERLKEPFRSDTCRRLTVDELREDYL